jgi:RNA polymerase sigma factor (sigma-70 family)
MGHRVEITDARGSQGAVQGVEQETGMATGLQRVLDHLHQALPPPEGVSDGQLLARFAATRDEAAFTALLRRHGGMVLGVAQRVVGHVQDAEDVFQATFLVLARRAGSVAQGEAVGNWLYGVAYRTALQARAANLRRQAREQQVEKMPHPLVLPEEPLDWRPLLDEELSCLPEKYRAALVLCDLEGQPRKEAAVRLGVPEGTLSSRLAAGRKLLGQRLSRRGLVLSGAMTAALAQSTAPAAVPSSLVSTTARVAALVASGQVNTATPAVALMKGVLNAMFFKKLKVAVVAVMVVAGLGVGGMAYQGGSSTARAQTAAKPRTELEALRRENELLKLNLEVVLEKVRAQATELRTLKAQASASSVRKTMAGDDGDGVGYLAARALNVAARTKAADTSAALKEVEAALKALREATDTQKKRQAAEALEKATKKLREQLK